MISFLWAQTESGIIGKDNQLPWNIKEEMQHFINYTKGKTVLMGRNTWESLSVKPLPNRKNILITSRKLEKSYNNLEISKNLKEILEKYKSTNEELVVIGGSQIYSTAFDYADKLVISVIKEEYQGDKYAPKWDKNDFNLTKEENYKEFTVYYYERY
ncbi:dihydrofolate reductase [Spiroplasma diminutum]|uniref:Dihydrofolate reductase n=1 Tax=Spiroplasma diminutum CUAS-1 TaxID=1276221 RepID=S5M0D5_9MOLU|nr:dihydrofolate reductase [Spiroplasma diminutum]AGR42311.1 dihydrofolate reductase [Spiroplasma diminutum CUAS-1]